MANDHEKKLQEHNPPAGRIGIIGGSFNPVHYGHLMIAENACQQYDLSRVIFVPTYHPPHKEFLGDDMCMHRCRMVELAIAGNDKFDISYMETKSKGINYTWKSLAGFKELYQDCRLYFIVGADSLFELDGWVHPEIIMQTAVILAAVRGETDENAIDRQITAITERFSGEICRLDTPLFDVSSRLIRQRVREGVTIRYLTPDPVVRYIREHSLYLK